MKKTLICLLVFLGGCRYSDSFSKKIECERLATEYEREQRALLHSDPDHMDKGFFIVEKSFYSNSRNSCLCIGKYQIVKTNSYFSDLTLRDLLLKEDIWHGTDDSGLPENKRPDIDKILKKYE